MSVFTFDFDDTLMMTQPCPEWGVRELGPNFDNIEEIRQLVSAGHTVFIVTGRTPRWESSGGAPVRISVHDFIREHQLPVSGVHFTSGKLKASTLLKLRSVKHWDDDEEEIRLAIKNGIEGVLVPTPIWDVIDFGNHD